MERITRWWRDRQQARVSTDTVYHSRSGLRFLVAFFAVIFLIMLIWSLMLGGRWVYRKASHKSTKPTQQVQPKEASDSKQTGEDEKVDSKPKDSIPQPSPSPPNATPTPSTTPPVAPSTPPQVPRTGPEEE